MAMLGKFQTPIGLLAVESGNGKLLGVDILPGTSKSLPPMTTQPLAREVSDQLHQYFKNGNYKFHLPLEVQGTDFQKRVWKIMAMIPAGEVMTYGEIAKKLSSSPRAVGNACRANPIPVIIPCHRVVGQKDIGGYGGNKEGPRVAIKNWLLKHEGVVLG